jgi:hypothetical protein
MECWATRTSDKCKGRIRCREGVSILSWPVTPGVSPWTKLGKRDYLSLKPVWKWQSNKLYETSNSEYVPVVICSHKQGHYNARRICEMLTLNEIHYNLATLQYCLKFPPTFTYIPPKNKPKSGKLIVAIMSVSYLNFLHAGENGILLHVHR